MSFGDYEKAISILQEIKSEYQARAEHAICGHRSSEADMCFHSITAIRRCVGALQDAWSDEEKAFARHYELMNKEDLRNAN